MLSPDLLPAAAGRRAMPAAAALGKPEADWRPTGLAEERAGRRRGDLGRGGRWPGWRGGTEGEARGEGRPPGQNRWPPPPEPQLALG